MNSKKAEMFALDSVDSLNLCANSTIYMNCVSVFVYLSNICGVMILVFFLMQIVNYKLAFAVYFYKG